MDKGSAVAATSVARQLRRKAQTTSTASTAPSYSSCMLPSKLSCTGRALSTTRRISNSGWSRCACAITAAMACATSTSLAPLERNTSRPMVCWPSTSAMARCSATVSRTSATSPRRTLRPCASGMRSSASSAALRAADSVRTVCSPEPTSVRPLGGSCCTWLSWRETSAAVTPSACMRSGCSSSCTSRCTPPMRLTAPTPLTPSMRLLSVLSTYQLSCSSSQPAPGLSRTL